MPCHDGCGVCCEVLGLRLSEDEICDIEQGNTAPYYYGDMQMLPMMLMRMTRDEAQAINPWLVTIHESEELSKFPPASYWSCRHYDSVGKRCGIYEERPRMCRDFPFYFSNPSRFALLPWPQCGYWEEANEPYAFDALEALPMLQEAQ